METLTDKKVPTLEQQIKFIRDARMLLESNPDVEVRWYADAVENFRAVEENLLALKLARHAAIRVESLIGQFKVITDGLNTVSVLQNKISYDLMKASDLFLNNKSEPWCLLPVESDVIIEIGSHHKVEWVQGHIHHFENFNPVVMTYFGQTYVVTNPEKIKLMEGNG